MDENENKHWLTVANIITFLRIIGTIILFTLRPFTASFFWVYSLTGLTDVLDGLIARKTKTVSDFGARLDSIADLLFYAVILIRVFPYLLNRLPNDIWYAVAILFCIRISSYIIAGIKYRIFASLHTYLNKLTGIAVFLIPFLLVTDYVEAFCWIVCAFSVLASLEELVIHIRSKEYNPNIKSIFISKR